MKNRRITSPPNRYHPTSTKLILVVDGFWGIVHVSELDRLAHGEDLVQAAWTELEKYVSRNRMLANRLYSEAKHPVYVEFENQLSVFPRPQQRAGLVIN